MSEYIPVKSVNDENFQERVIESDLPVIVVFEKSCWGTTHILRPIIEKISSDFANSINVFRYNMELNSNISEHYRIESSTSILVFNKGNVVHKTGVISRVEFKKIINALLTNTFNHT